MSFGGFGRNSGPVGPPKAQPTFGQFSQPASPPISAPPFPGSAAPPRSPNPRTFGSSEGVRSPLPFDNARPATGTPRPSVPSIRPAPLQWGDRQSSRTLGVSGPIPKRSPPSGPRDHGTNIAPKAYGVQDLGKIRPPPVQYTENLLHPDTDSNERIASLQWGNRQSSPAGHIVPPIQKRSPPSAPRNLGTSISSKAYPFPGVERTRSPPVQYTDDFLNPDSDGEERVTGKDHLWEVERLAALPRRGPLSLVLLILKQAFHLKLLACKIWKEPDHLLFNTQKIF